MGEEGPVDLPKVGAQPCKATSYPMAFEVFEAKNLQRTLIMLTYLNNNTLVEHW